MTFPHKMLRELKPNWGSYGAKAIDERCVEKAFEIWRQLSGEWQVVPCNDGGVQLEQHRDGFDIEITVSAASTGMETRSDADDTPPHLLKQGYRSGSVKDPETIPDPSAEVELCLKCKRRRESCSCPDGYL